jgi:hypothetical protein
MMQSIPPLVETTLGVSYVQSKRDEWQFRANARKEDAQTDNRRAEATPIANPWWLRLVPIRLARFRFNSLIQQETSIERGHR